MADEKTGGNNPSNAGSGNANKGSSRNNRRRPLRSKRRGRKPEEISDKPEARSEGQGRKEPRNDSRSGEGRNNEGRNTRTGRGQPNASSAADKSLRDNRERRRRRRMRSKQRGPNESVAPAVEDTFKDLPPLVPAFVYTHVLRPSTRDSFEFRTEHFSNVTRRMEDFHIDLSPLYPEGGDEIKGVAWMPPVGDRPVVTDDREFDDGGYDDVYDDEDESGAKAAAQADPNKGGLLDDTPPLVKGMVADDTEAELLDDPDWDAEESEDAARLDGASGAELASDFYAEMDDSVVDEYPEEELDD